VLKDISQTRTIAHIKKLEIILN